MEDWKESEDAEQLLREDKTESERKRKMSQYKE